MAYLTDAEKQRLGPLIMPFERCERIDKLRRIEEGEGDRNEFIDFIHDGYDNHSPQDCMKITPGELAYMLKKADRPGSFKKKSYLWVIDGSSIKIIREKTSNFRRTINPDYVCHTNLTGSGSAYVGGEIYFCSDGKFYINYFSDRYGNPSLKLWKAAKRYIRSVGYMPLIDIIDLLNKKKK